MARMTAKVGVLPLGIAGRRRPRDVVILGYHRVGVGRSEIDMQTSVFERQLDLLAARGEVRSLDDALAWTEAASSSPLTTGRATSTSGSCRSWAERHLPAVLYLATAMPDDPDPLRLGPGLSWSMRRESVATGIDRDAIPHAHPRGSRPRARDPRRRRRCVDPRS